MFWTTTARARRAGEFKERFSGGDKELNISTATKLKPTSLAGGGSSCLWGNDSRGNCVNICFFLTLCLSRLFSGTDDGSVRFWRLETGAGESFRTHENTVSALAAYRDRQGSLILASAGFEGAITIWRAQVKDGFDRHQVRKRRREWDRVRAKGKPSSGHPMLGILRLFCAGIEAFKHTTSAVVDGNFIYLT